MKNLVLYFATLLTLIIIFTPTTTYATTPNHFEIRNGVLISYSGPGGHVIIPEGVTEIGPSVFSDNFDVTSVTFPSTLVVISGDAFRHARNIREINLPPSVTSIGEGAFAFVWPLATVNIPPTIEYIGRNAFQRTRWRETVFDRYDWLGPFSHGAFLVRNGERYGLASLDGTEILPTRYDAIQVLRNGYRELGRGGTWTLLNANLQPTDTVDNLMRVMTANPTDYVLESEHFIFHWDATRFLVGRISPAAFASWLCDMDTLYQVYYDFVGAAPSNGAKINVWVEEDPDRYRGWAWASVWGNSIWVPATWGAGDMEGRELYGTIGFGWAHELGHNFHYHAWTFDAEFAANLNVAYAMHINQTYQIFNDTLFGSEHSGEHHANRWYQNALDAYNDGTLHDFSRGSDDIHLYFGPIIQYAGWDVIREAIRSYFNTSFPLQEYVYTGERNAVRLANLLARITYFNDGVCVLSYSVDNGEILRRAYPVERVPRTALGSEDFGRNSLDAVFVVPSFIQRIESYTFAYQTSLETIIIPEAVTHIGDRTFLMCENLRHVYIFSRDVEIHGWAFFSGWGVDFDIGRNITLYGFPGSTVEAFAQRHRTRFVPLLEDASSSAFVPGQGFYPPVVRPTPTLRLVIGSTTFMYRGNTVANDAAPFIDVANNRTMIPLRIVATGLGAEVRFNDETRTVYITHGGTEFPLVVDVPLAGDMGTPVIIDGRTFVPARYVIEILGATVRWDGETQAVYIYR